MRFFYNEPNWKCVKILYYIRLLVRVVYERYNRGCFFQGKPLWIIFTIATSVVRNIPSPAPVTTFAKTDYIARLGKPCAILDSLLDGRKDFPFLFLFYFSGPNIAEVFFEESGVRLLRQVLFPCVQVPPWAWQLHPHAVLRTSRFRHQSSPLRKEKGLSRTGVLQKKPRFRHRTFRVPPRHVSPCCGIRPPSLRCSSRWSRGASAGGFRGIWSCDLHWKTRRDIATGYPIIEFFLTVCGMALFDRNGGSAFSGRVAL